ncbi:MazG nucleotide pyrophosphohydrolase domain-containing protein [Photobacterium galatheae]|uniref:Nucleotide pyrophosphohydrolase n=1 Tax=Photobacterium galatheae TaxID=1654360 RepID=A0A066RHG5_9GAMM|nr:MazG nucleotide pyrophosphohydrolase domain-containing protein [Photobacterium galatheae]KDM89895.1 nucleotide pyrophosphohydrolase [Photobacterium galatheae]MCM0151188.1 nucleotide pyrophosphohydrolase [Photobacterium galatheae]
MKISELQAHVRAVDHHPENPSGYFLKLIEEVGELSEAIRKGKEGQPDPDHLKGTIAEELYDVLYYLCALANLHGVDLTQTHFLKDQLNQQKYRSLIAAPTP